MSFGDKTLTLANVQPIGPLSVQLRWSDGTLADIDLGAVLESSAFAPLHDPDEFAKVQIGDWGHSLVWSSGPELGAETLWLETLSATGRSDTRAFLDWRLRNGLSLSKAADALGISRRMVAY